MSRKLQAIKGLVLMAAFVTFQGAGCTESDSSHSSYVKWGETLRTSPDVEQRGKAAIDLRHLYYELAAKPGNEETAEKVCKLLMISLREEAGVNYVETIEAMLQSILITCDYSRVGPQCNAYAQIVRSELRNQLENGNDNARARSAKIFGSASRSADDDAVKLLMSTYDSSGDLETQYQCATALGNIGTSQVRYRRNILNFISKKLEEPERKGSRDTSARVADKDSHEYIDAVLFDMQMSDIDSALRHALLNLEREQ